VSPILTRPVREQLEHDRVIRQLQGKYKRKTDVVINPGNEQNQSVTVGELVVYPDLLVFAEGGRRLLLTVEVETGESVNAIEARAEWGVYSKLKGPLHLYVPPVCVDAVKRICAEYQILVSELWTYTTSFDQVRFTMVHRDPNAPVVKIPDKVAKPAPKPSAPAATIRQAEGRPEPGRGTKAAKPAAKAKPVAKNAAKKPAAKAKTKSNAKTPKGRPEPGRGAKAKKGAKKRR